MYTNRYPSRVGKLSLQLALVTTLLLNSFCSGAQRQRDPNILPPETIKIFEQLASNILTEDHCRPVNELFRTLEVVEGFASIKRMRAALRQEERLATFPLLVQHIHDKTAGIRALHPDIEAAHALFRQSTNNPIRILEKIQQRAYPTSFGDSIKYARKYAPFGLKAPNGVTTLVKELIPCVAESCRTLMPVCVAMLGRLRVQCNALSAPYEQHLEPAPLRRAKQKLDSLVMLLAFNKYVLSYVRTAAAGSFEEKERDKIARAGTTSFFYELGLPITHDDLHTERKLAMKVGLFGVGGLLIGGPMIIVAPAVYAGGSYLSGGDVRRWLDHIGPHRVQVNDYKLVMTSFITVTQLTLLRYVIEQCIIIQESFPPPPPPPPPDAEEQEEEADEEEAGEEEQEVELGDMALFLQGIDEQVQAEEDFIGLAGFIPEEVEAPHVEVALPPDQGMHEAEEEHIEEEKAHPVRVKTPEREQKRSDEKEASPLKPDQNKKEAETATRLLEEIRNHKTPLVKTMIESYLEEYPQLINYQDNQGRTPLFAAVEKAVATYKTDMVQLLLEKRANILHQDHKQSKVHDLILPIDEPRHQPLIDMLERST